MTSLTTLAGWLFGSPDAGAGTGRRWRYRYAATVVLLAAILVARRPDAVSNPQFWAEDGSIFFQENLTVGFVRAFVKQYRGYPNLAQRLIALVGGWVSFANAPRVYTTAAIAVTALAVASFCLPGFRHLVRRDWLRAGVCVACVCIPAGEALATPTNLGWFLAVRLFLLSMVRVPRSTPRLAALSAGGIVAVLSTPLAIVMVPLWLLRAAAAGARRDRHDLVFAVSLLAAQGVVLAMTHALGAEPDLVLDLPGYGKVAVGFQWMRVWDGVTYTFASLYLPPAVMSALVSQHRWLLVEFATLLLLGSMAGLAAGAGRERLAGVLVCFSGIVVAIIFMLIGRPVMNAVLGSLEFSLYPGRYLVFPGALALICIAIVLDGLGTVTGAFGTVLVCAAIAWAWAPSFSMRYSDMHWPMWAVRLEAKMSSGSDEPLVIPVNGAQRIELGVIRRSAGRAE